MTEQYTNYANVRVEDIPPYETFQLYPGRRFAWRSPIRYLSLNGKMEFHYIHEWNMPMPSGECLIREEYFGDKIISTSYRYERGLITQVHYSDRAAYFVEDGGVRKEELKDNKVEPAQPLAVEKTDEFAHLTVEGKLQLVKDKLKEFMSILDSTFVMDDRPTQADNGGEPIRYFGAIPDTPAVSVEDFGAKGDWDGVSGTDNTQAFQDAMTYVENKDTASSQYIDKLIAAQKANESLPIYEGAYLNADALTSEHAFVDGKVFLIMNDSKTGAENCRRRVGKGTEIVHLVDYVSIAHYGPLNMSTEWSVLPEDALVHGEDGEKTFLRAGTRLKVLDYAGVFNGGEINPGTLAVQYADCIYPSL